MAESNGDPGDGPPESGADGGGQVNSGGTGGASRSGSGSGRYVAIGCVMSVAGFFSGAMVAVLVARFVSWGSHCRYDAELPACHWPQYAAIGGLIGAVTLPALIFWQLLRPGREIVDEPQDL